MVDRLAGRVLYIDDDPGIRRLVQRRLEAAGASVTLAESGADGVALAMRESFVAIALDHFMPQQDGLEVLASLRALPDPPPVVFVTASEEPRIAIAALKAGAADYVVKDTSGTFLELLAPVLKSAIVQAETRRAREAAEREVRESRDRLERLSAQQALLLREVNHRVSNSLQLIRSLIELQARRVSNVEARDLLRRAAERVEAVAMVHRRLYTSNDVTHVDMDQYLAGMIEEFHRALGDEGDETRRIELISEPVRIETDKAVSIGLIVNELVTNAVKYAYPHGGGGSVRVSLAKCGTAGMTLTVEDDGVGYRASSEPRGSGLGTMIVQALSETVGATITRDPAWSGTRYVVEVAGPRQAAAAQ